MSFLGQREMVFVRRVFEYYYRKLGWSRISIPPQPERREYGYFTFGEKLMIRHLAFGSGDEVRQKLVSVTPLHAYVSSAYYKYPAAPMEEKEWLGADLVFDIDADHMGLSCVDEHTYVICRKCGISEAENRVCSECGSEVKEVEWVCEECLSKTRSELVKLIELLLDDFGVEEGELEPGFSGNRGYHLVVHSEELMSLDQMARREVIRYVTGNGLEPAYLGIPSTSRGKRGRPKSYGYPEPSLDAWGWRGRLIRGIYRALMDEELLKGLEYRLRGVDLESVRRVWGEGPTWEIGNVRLWSELSKQVVEEESVKIDPVVTQDVHRLMRLGGTLNGKTGLLAARLSLEGVETFDPLKDASVLDEEKNVEVRVLYSPAFRLGNSVFDEVSEPRVKRLPLNAAVYLLCRGLAEIV